MRTFLILIPILAASSSVHADPTAAHPKAAGCSSLGATPIDVSDDYAGFFDRYGCTSCHRGAAPPADLDLSGTNFDAACGIVDQDSSTAPIKRVEPWNPGRSLIYQVINCAQPDGAFRMAEPPLADRAVIHDWIARGAPVLSNDCPNPSPILADGFEPQLR